MTKAVKQVLMQCKVGKAQKALLTMVSTVDNQEIWIKGNSEAVKPMKAWINFARKQPDRDELMRPFFVPTKAGRLKVFPSICDEGWSISIVK